MRVKPDIIASFLIDPAPASDSTHCPTRHYCTGPSRRGGPGTFQDLNLTVIVTCATTYEFAHIGPSRTHRAFQEMIGLGFVDAISVDAVAARNFPRGAATASYWSPSLGRCRGGSISMALMSTAAPPKAM
jgi:hypothetical protein